ncbi:MAG: sulfatase [Planctomycetes bacterium]|nr:sulfatase [Planctomycetota bacterium]
MQRPSLAASLARHAALASTLLASALCGCRGDDEGAPEAPVAAPRPRHVVWIVLDTLRADALGCYGNARATSPVLDELAARGVLVEDAFAHAPWTRPSAASMLSSLHPPEHGIRSEDPRDILPEAVLTLAEHFRAHAFRTAAISENPHVQQATGFGQGFELFLGKPLWQSEPAWMLEQARAVLGAVRESKEPLFLYVHALDPHDPYEPSEEDRRAILGALRSGDADVDAGRALRRTERLLAGEALSSEDLQVLRGLYEAEVRGADRFVGELLELVREHGLLEDALVLVTSDHGEEFLEHGALRHGDQLYDESLRVPLLFSGPGLAPRRVRAALARHVDLAPTVLELLDLPQPEGWRGRSLAPALRGATQQPAALYAETRWRELGRAALRGERWKLLQDERTGERALFDLSSDPGETRDRAAAELVRTEELARDLELLQRAFRSAGSGDPSSAPEYDRATWEALQKLGYTGAPEPLSKQR